MLSFACYLCQMLLANIFYNCSNSGPDSAGQRQAQDSGKAAEAFSVSVNSQGISASTLTENCNKLKEISHKSTLTFDEPSAEGKHFLKVVGRKLTVSLLLICFSLNHKSGYPKFYYSDILLVSRHIT